MTKEGIAVTPSVVRWARIRAGYSAEEAAEVFKRLPEWEAGSSLPTYPQLEQLAEKFKVPVAVFFFPEPPKTPPIEETFRTLPAAELSALPRRVRYLLRKAKALQINLAELHQARNPATRLITREVSFGPDTSISQMARRVREYLGVTLDDQRRWPDVESALENWRKVLTDAGVFVFKDAFRAEQFSGFSLYDDVFPIIYVNNSVSKTRQVFTLFHELAHLLFSTSGVDTDGDEYVSRLADDARRIEVACNKLAAEFLLPESAFEIALRGKDATESTAEALAATFHVSREFIFRRFLDRGLVDLNAYKSAAERWAQQRRPSAGGDYYNTQISYLGSSYISFALSQYYQNRIDESQVAEYLNITPKNLSAFEARFARRGV